MPPVVCRRAHVLFTLFVFFFSHSGVQHILCCVFLRNVCHVLPVSHDCPFWIAQSVFSNVYLMKIRRSSKLNLHFVCTDILAFHFKTSIGFSHEC
jgi:hypothetical protein